MGLSYAKEIVSTSSAVERDEQTDHGAVTSIPISEIAFSYVA